MAELERLREGAEPNGLLGLLACHCEAAAVAAAEAIEQWRRMWSVTIFVQSRQPDDRPVIAGLPEGLVDDCIRFFC